MNSRPVAGIDVLMKCLHWQDCLGDNGIMKFIIRLP